MLNEDECPRCHHGNEAVKIKRTFFRRRPVGVCSGLDEPISGMAGDFDCPCRGPFHQTTHVEPLARRGIRSRTV